MSGTIIMSETPVTHDGGGAQPPPPSARGWKIPVTIGAIVLSVIGAGGWLMHRAESGVNKVALADDPKGVTVAVAKPSKYRESRRYVGTLEAWQQARIGPQLASGFVDTVLVRPGALVKRGDVLATLDCRNASTASQAIAHQARALEERQKATATEVTRMGELLDGGYIAPNEVDQKRAQAASNEAQIQALLAQASGKSLEVNDCVLRSPFDGEVAHRYADPGTFSRPGSPIVELVDRSIVRLSADVPEIDFDAVPPKTPISLKLLATGKSMTGEISRRAPSADPSTRTVHFEVDLPNTKHEIPVGTTAEIRVDVGEEVDALEVPILSAKIRGKKATVFVIESSIAKRVVVDVIGERDGSLFVKADSAVKAGTHVVTQGRSLLANNDHVSMKLEPSAVSASSSSPPDAKRDESGHDKAKP